jgi:hypothetical protein
MTVIDWLVSQLNKPGFEPVVTDEEIKLAKEIEYAQLHEADRNGARRIQYYRDQKYGGEEYWCDDNLPLTFEEYYAKTFKK